MIGGGRERGQWRGIEGGMEREDARRTREVKEQGIEEGTQQ